MPKAKILFVDACHPILEESFFHANCEVVYQPESIGDDTIDISPYLGLIVRSKKIDSSIINRMPNLKFIGRVGAGLENIDVVYAEQKGIECFNSPEGSRHTVGEHTLGLLLAVVNKICKADAEIKKGIWNRNANWGVEIKDKTIGIVGYGNMGSAFAEKISGFGAKVIAYDKYKFDYSNSFVHEAEMEMLFEECDVLSLHIPLTEETKFLVNASYLNKFKKDIFLINTSRGKILKTEDLVSALKTGKVKGAGLDVLEYERAAFEALDLNHIPSAFKYLCESDKVVITPHIAGWTNESYYKLPKVIFNKVKSLL